MMEKKAVNWDEIINITETPSLGKLSYEIKMTGCDIFHQSKFIIYKCRR